MTPIDILLEKLREVKIMSEMDKNLVLMHLSKALIEYYEWKQKSFMDNMK